MSAYRYVVFPKGKQPTVDEVRQWESYAGLLSRRFAYGFDKREGGVAIAIDASAFEHAMASDLEFEALIQKWQVRGCTLLEHLSFVKDHDALQPVDPHALQAALYRLPGARRERPVVAKELAAKEAVGRSRLAVEQTLRRHAALGRFAAWMPYLLIGLGTVVMIGAGVIISNRMLESDRERRKETIERVANDALAEPLSGHATHTEAIAAEEPSETRD